MSTPKLPTLRELHAYCERTFFCMRCGRRDADIFIQRLTCVPESTNVVAISHVTRLRRLRAGKVKT